VKDNYRIRAEIRDYSAEVAIYASTDTHAATSITISTEPIEDAAKHPRPGIVLPMQIAQNLLDGLIQAGVRPTNNVDKATQNKHLEDMRSIVFHQLKMEKP
jgi:predicted neutral ceramidase superfamily lipid hydrolase